MAATRIRRQLLLSGELSARLEALASGRRTFDHSAAAQREEIEP